MPRLSGRGRRSKPRLGSRWRIPPRCRPPRALLSMNGCVSATRTVRTVKDHSEKLCRGSTREIPWSGGPGCAQAAAGVRPERQQLVTVDLASSSTGIRVSSAHTFLMPGALIYYHDPSDPRSISRKSISKSGSRRHRVNLLWFRQLQFRQLPTGRIRSPVMNRGRGPE